MSVNVFSSCLHLWYKVRLLLMIPQSLFGEAVSFRNLKIPHLFTIIKQHGALLAKGRLLGLQFDALFQDDLHIKIGIPAIRAAESLREALRGKGYLLYFESPTNQIFCIIKNDVLESWKEKIAYSFWEKYDEVHTVIRLATDWGTTDAETSSAH